MPRHPTRLEQAAIRAHNQHNLPADGQWLAEELFRHAAQGSRAARRLLVNFRGFFRYVGAKLPEPTWPPVWDASRRDEIGLP